MPGVELPDKSLQAIFRTLKEDVDSLLGIGDPAVQPVRLRLAKDERPKADPLDNAFDADGTCDVHDAIYTDRAA